MAGLTEREIIHAVKLDRPLPVVPRRLIVGIEVVEENTTLLTQQVPLCVFNAPATPGAKTTYSEAEIHVPQPGET